MRARHHSTFEIKINNTLTEMVLIHKSISNFMVVVSIEVKNNIHL